AFLHSWVGESDRQLVDTAVNGYEWPVPIPLGVTLEAVRDELLRHGARYCWLDVLCLRQHDPRPNSSKVMKKIRTIAWEVDLPTISNLYYGDVNIVRHYNGLGKEFKTSGWDSEFHWTNRVWTLQECRDGCITGGIRDNDYQRFFGSCYRRRSTRRTNKARIRAVEILYALPAPTRTPCGLYGVLSEVRIRKAKQEVDKIAGIGFIMSTDRDVTLPIFSETMDTEEAWTLIVRCMTTSMGDELLFRFPVPGHGDHGALWFLSWKQI
ncbi:hypothetical protein FPQ18DRAFT_237163, partial [Pyronema domesticum]